MTISSIFCQARKWVLWLFQEYKWLCSPQIALLWFSLLSQGQREHWTAEQGAVWHLVAPHTQVHSGRQWQPQRSLRKLWQDFLLKYNSLFNSTTDAFYVIPYSKEVIKQPARATVLRLPTGGYNTEFCISLPHHHLSSLPMAFFHAVFTRKWQPHSRQRLNSIIFIQVENLNQAWLQGKVSVPLQP